MADIFSILTRGTNLKRRRENPTNKPTTTSIAVDPTSKRAAKRKRKAEEKIHEDAEIPNELDFFGTAAQAVREKKQVKLKGSGEDGEVDDESGSGSEEELESVDGDEMQEDMPELSEEDKRRILKENKLKIVQLHPLPEEKVEEVSEKKKKKKKGKAKEEDAKKKKKKNYVQAIVTPMQSFTELRSRYQLSRRVCENVASRMYPGPTQVQIGALPLLLNPSTIEPVSPGEKPVNLFVCAPTGSGKTLAFTLPLLSEILKKQKENGGKLSGPYALVLVPTKELAAQIVYETRRFAKGTGIRATLVRRGVDVQAVKSHILVGTPGVLAKELEGQGLPTVKQLILDEADVLLDEMFREQTVTVWNSCKLGKGTSLRVSLWSATMPSSTETLARELILPAEGEKVKKREQPVIYRLTVGIQASSLPPVHHELTYAATEQGKLLALRQLIKSPTGLPTPVLIFTQTIPRATALQSELLYDLPQQGRVHVLHSSLSETQRMQTMDKFREGEIWLLITTDLLSRGVDFAGVKLVINYDIPTSVASFIHRVGRTARGGAEGKAITFYTKEDIPYVRGIVGVVDRAEGGHGWLLNALPKVGKREKQRLKKHGVDARKDIKITTKSAWERRKEERRKGAKEGSKRRTRKVLEDAENNSGSDDGAMAVGGENGEESD